MLSQIRKERGLTQIQLAQKLGFKQSTISMWETCSSRPNIETIYKLAKLLNCTEQEILNCFKDK